MFEAANNRYRVYNGMFRVEGKRAPRKQLAGLVEELSELQRSFHAHDRHSLLRVFQAMDAAGEAGTKTTSRSWQSCRASASARPAAFLFATGSSMSTSHAPGVGPVHAIRMGVQV